MQTITLMDLNEKPKFADSIPDEVTDFFFFIWPNPSNPGYNLASNRNEYQKIFMGLTCGRWVWLTTIGSQMVARLSDLSAGHTLLASNICFCFWYSFLLEAE
jgi:hypothetical protein